MSINLKRIRLIYQKTLDGLTVREICSTLALGESTITRAKATKEYQELLDGTNEKTDLGDASSEDSMPPLKNQNIFNEETCFLMFNKFMHKLEAKSVAVTIELTPEELIDQSNDWPHLRERLYRFPEYTITNQDVEFMRKLVAEELQADLDIQARFAKCKAEYGSVCDPTPITEEEADVNPEKEEPIIVPMAKAKRKRKPRSTIAL
jgi:hypothetical protein